MNPGRKFITGVQPRGVRDTFDMEDIADEEGIGTVMVSEVIWDDVEVGIDMSRTIIFPISMELEVGISVELVVLMELFPSEPSPNPVPA